MHIARRLGAGAEDVSRIADRRTQKALGHMAATGITGTKDKDGGFETHRGEATMSRGWEGRRARGHASEYGVSSLEYRGSASIEVGPSIPAWPRPTKDGQPYP
jgi:hypothetical protein